MIKQANTTTTVKTSSAVPKKTMRARVAASTSYSGLARSLGISPNGRNLKSLRGVVREAKINTKHFVNP